MKRVGKFTGEVFEMHENVAPLQCCTCVPDDAVEDEDFMTKLRAKDIIDCSSCSGGCQAWMESILEKTP